MIRLESWKQSLCASFTTLYCSAIASCFENLLNCKWTILRIKKDDFREPQRRNIPGAVLRSKQVQKQSIKEQHETHLLTHWAITFKSTYSTREEMLQKKQWPYSSSHQNNFVKFWFSEYSCTTVGINQSATSKDWRLESILP